MKKAKKFAAGGLNELSGLGAAMTPARGVGPTDGVGISPFPYPGGVSPAGGGGAFGGLQQVDAGGRQIGDSLQGIQQNLGGPGRQTIGGPGLTFKKGGKVSSASSRGDGIATKGKTKGRMV